MYPMVFVEWEDAQHGVDGGGWSPMSSLHNAVLPVIHSCGFVLMDDDDFMVLAVCVDGEDFFCGEITIPKKAIRALMYLEGPEEWQ